MLEYHPIWPFIIAALLMPCAGKVGRRALSLLAPAAATGTLLALPLGAASSIHVLGQELIVLRLDELGRLFALAFTAYGFIAALYAWYDDSPVAKMAGLGLAAGGVGVTLAADLMSLSIFWEWLTVSSLFLIWTGRRDQSLAAGFRYLLFHLAGGVCLLSGILMHLAAGGDPAVGQLPLEGPAAWLILIGMAANAAVVPLHAWLPDAYPRATIYGTVFLAAFTTKSAVYALARTFPGEELLIWFGAAMTLYGVFFAVLENNLRRLLSYHIVSQVGYMVCGVGLATLGTSTGETALNGATSHAFSHIFYKGLLMMSVGAVIFATGRERLSDLGGLSRPMKATMIFFIIGALSIAGAPLLNGFVSKSMTVSAAAYAGRGPIELILLIAAMGTFLSIGLKLTWYAFLVPPPRPVPVRRPVRLNMHIAMALAAAVCIVTGLWPWPLYDLLPFPERRYDPFTPDHFVGALQLLVGTTLGFWMLRHKLKGAPLVSLDADHLYRRPLAALVAGAGTLLDRAGAAVRTFNLHAIAAGWASLIRYQALRYQTTLAYHATIILAVLIVIAALIALAG